MRPNWNGDLFSSCCGHQLDREAICAMTTPSEHVIFPTEAEAFVQELSPFTITEIGSERWSLQRERLEQLNMQAVYNVTHDSDEFVKDFMIAHEKLSVLVHELLAVEVWREKVFPLMIRQCSRPTTSFPAYLVLYHEGTVASLLETALYYRESCESAGECILDLVDYCQRRITKLVAGGEGGGEEEAGEGMEEGSNSDSDSERDLPPRKEIIQELMEQQRNIHFDISIKAISIVRYITDHLSGLPLSVTTRLLNTHNMTCVLVELLQNAPWTKTGEKGELLKYDNGRWGEVAPSNRLKLTKTEGQVWLSLYHLLLHPDCQQKYEFNSHNKGVILKLRRYLSEPLLEQLPPLTDLQRYLEQLSLMDPPAGRRDLILEQVPAIHESLVRESSGKWSSIAKKHAKLLLEPSPEELKAKAKRWVDTYNLDMLETIVAGPPKCALCGREASKRCSRCRNEWYCGRECQVKHWKNHETSCDMVSERQ